MDAIHTMLIEYKHGAIGGELADTIERIGIDMVCQDDMTILISKEDWDKLTAVCAATIDDWVILSL